MRILCVATKPPWPPIDGGRLLLRLTLEALSARGHQIDLVAPYDPATDDPAQLTTALKAWCQPRLVPAPRRSRIEGVIQALGARQPLSIALHDRSEVRAEVERLVVAERFDVVHAEQVQALVNCEPAVERGLRVVLRCQNVECDLWNGLAKYRRWLSPLIRAQARSLEHYETQAIKNASATIALTQPDATRLQALSSMKVQTVPAPFPAELEAARHHLPGSPALVMLGSPDWFPNRDGDRWFTREIWPSLSTRFPGVTVHRLHGRQLHSRDAFPTHGAVLVVPLRIASGVRMKILEGWARGVPVIATPAAASGLEAHHGRELLIANDARSFCAAVAEVQRDRARVGSLVDAGRALLRQRHQPESVAKQLEAIYKPKKVAVDREGQQRQPTQQGRQA